MTRDRINKVNFMRRMSQLRQFFIHISVYFLLQETTEGEYVRRLVSSYKWVTQSSTLSGSQWKFAVDGVYGTSSCTDTNKELSPWLQVDLGIPYEIRETKLFTRSETIRSFNVTILTNGMGWVLCGVMSTTSDGSTTYSMTCGTTGIVGKSVRITLLGSGTLSVCEMEVWANYDRQLVSRNKPVLQSSTFYGAIPLMAVDGNYRLIGTYNGCTQTDNELNPWWQINLGMAFNIREVIFWNREDCCPDRLGPANITVLTDDKEWSLCGTIDTVTTAGMIYAISCGTGGIMGKSVRITHLNTSPTYLAICEMEVWTSVSSKLAYIQNPSSVVPGRNIVASPQARSTTECATFCTQLFSCSSFTFNSSMICNLFGDNGGLFLVV